MPGRKALMHTDTHTHEVFNRSLSIRRHGTTKTRSAIMRVTAEKLAVLVDKSGAHGHFRSCRRRLLRRRRRKSTIIGRWLVFAVVVVATAAALVSDANTRRPSLFDTRPLAILDSSTKIGRIVYRRSSGPSLGRTWPRRRRRRIGFRIPT